MLYTEPRAGKGKNFVFQKYKFYNRAFFASFVELNYIIMGVCQVVISDVQSVLEIDDEGIVSERESMA